MSGTERSVRLDLGMPPRSDLGQENDTASSSTQDSRDEHQASRDSGRFQALLKTGAPSPDSNTPATTKPLDLFAQSPINPADPVAKSEPAARADNDLTALDQQLAQAVDRLLVGQGRHGGASVQMQLADEQLPGVQLEVFHDEGAVITQFTCAVEEAREKLARSAPWLADRLAERLRSDVLVRVLADDPEDPYPVEARASCA